MTMNYYCTKDFQHTNKHRHIYSINKYAVKLSNNGINGLNELRGYLEFSLLGGRCKIHIEL